MFRHDRHRDAPTGRTKVFLVSSIVSLCVVASFAASFTVPSGELKTIGQAMVKARAGDTIWVEPGEYRENISLTNGIVLASRTLFKAVINGRGSKKVVTLGANSTITGFDIRNGDIGVYSIASGGEISKCRIHNNQQSGIMCAGNLPTIEDNIIAYNGGSGIQGWDVRSTISTINHNTIVSNTNSGIAIGGTSEVILENNIIAFNIKIGLKIDPGVRVAQKTNCYYANTDAFETLAESNIAADPMFIDPRNMNFMLNDLSQCRNNASDNQNIGARLTY
jgi:hypothetical protein